jgi:hypothetical protein
MTEKVAPGGRDAVPPECGTDQAGAPRPRPRARRGFPAIMGAT